MGKAYLSQEDAPQTPVRGVSPQSEQKTPVLASVLSPMTPLASSDQDADDIFSPPGSVYTDVTDDDGWDTPTKPRPGRSSRSCSTRLFPSSFDQLKAENSPYMGPGTTGPIDNTDCFIAAQALPSEEPSQYIQKLNINTEDLPKSTSSLHGATFCGHRTGRYLVQAQQSTRGRSASLGHIESYTSQTRATRTSECPRTRSLDRWSLRCQEVCNGPRASCAPSSTHIVPNIEVSPPNNTSDVTIITKIPTLSDVKCPTAKNTEKGLFKFNVSDVTFATPSSDDGAKANRLAIRGQTKGRRRTINSFSTEMRESYPENSGSNSRYSFSSAVPGSLRLFSEELNHHSTSEEAKAPDYSLLKVSGHHRRHSMNLMPDMDFLQDGAYHRRNRSSTSVDTIYSGDQTRLTSNYYPARIHRGHDQVLPPTDTIEKHTNRKYAHQTLISYYPKSYVGKSISRVLEEKIIAPLSENEIKREGHIYIYWNPGNFGRVKIGYTKNVEQRLRNWEKQCKKTLSVHFPKEAERGRPVQHIARVEKLVHAELKDYRRQEVQCPGCTKRHIEWFELDKNVAVDVVKKWTNWMAQMPYIQKDRGGESQWVLTDEARKLLRDVCKPHERLPG